ncbi:MULTISPECIES: type II toxin-antitoxin system PemK/MazF family toxin [unclassified Variovorax]|uniref:type II toxin-antitoxin system PemK/MazF family toxin n=1 Tax=unclassified Variovorax TaxID=663243 RepID=UPI003ED09748
MSRNYWKPRPKLGDIVECSFPQEMGVPGPKNRPALVLQVEEATDDPAGSVVVVAYATSQNTTAVCPGEFVIEASAKTGLTKATKFDLVNHHRLSFDDAWFAPAPGKTPRYPRRGRLDLQDAIVKRKLQSAIMEARNQPKSF